MNNLPSIDDIKRYLLQNKCNDETATALCYRLMKTINKYPDYYSNGKWQTLADKWLSESNKQCKPNTRVVYKNQFNDLPTGENGVDSEVAIRFVIKYTPQKTEQEIRTLYKKWESEDFPNLPEGLEGYPESFFWDYVKETF